MASDPSLINRLLDRRDALRRRVLRHRGVLAAAIAALTIYLVVHALTAPPPPSEAVWVAARDLTSGTTLSRSDLALRSYPKGLAPDGIVTSPRVVLGRTLASPVRTGMPLARDALVGTRWLHGYPGLSAVPVRITDPAVVPLLRIGDRVDLFTAGTGHRSSELVPGAVVLALPAAHEEDDTSLTGRLVVVGVPSASVAQVSDASISSYLTVVWQHPTGG